jgi:Helicase associated domain
VAGNVPTKNSSNRALGRWVSTQRSMYKRFKEGKIEKDVKEMTQRIRKLNRIKFCWSLAPGSPTSEEDGAEGAAAFSSDQLSGEYDSNEENDEEEEEDDGEEEEDDGDQEVDDDEDDNVEAEENEEDFDLDFDGYDDHDDHGGGIDGNDRYQGGKTYEPDKVEV